MNLFRRIKSGGDNGAAVPAALDTSEDAARSPPPNLSKPPGVPWSPAGDLRRNATRPRSKSEKALLLGMDERFYDDDFDPVTCVLSTLPFDCANLEIEDHLAYYDRLRHLISAKLSNQVLANTANFVHVMERIQELEMDLTRTIVLLSSTRRVLRVAKTQLVQHWFSTVRTERELQRVASVCQVLQRIQVLQENETRFREALDQFEFELAIQLLHDCEACVPELERVVCVSPLLQRVRTSPDAIELALDRALARVCQARFSHSSNAEQVQMHRDLLDRVVRGFVALESLPAFCDRLVDAYSVEADRCACEALGGNDQDSFIECTKVVTEDNFVESFFACLSAVSRLLFAYFRTRQLLNLSRHSMETSALTEGRVTLWRRVQARLSDLVSNTSSSATHLKLGQVLRVLNASSQLMHIGERFSGADSTILRPALLQRCRSYFGSFHSQSVERLMLTLSADQWVRLPLPSGFGIDAIKELRHEAALHEDRALDAETDAERLFEMFAEGLDLFVYDGESPLLSPSNAKRAFAQDDDTKPILTTSAMVTTRFIGQYIGVMRSLRPIADEVTEAIADLFDVYLYAVFSLFVPEAHRFADPNESRLRSTAPHLALSVDRILQRLRTGTFCNGHVRLLSQRHTGEPPMIVRLDSVHLNDPSTLHGLLPRFVSLESLRFVVEVIKWMDAIVPSYVSKSKRVRVLEIATAADAIESELNRIVYARLAPRLVSPRPVIATISSFKFDTTELSTNHHAFVDKFLDLFMVFSRRLKGIRGDDDGVSAEVVEQIWRHTLEHSVRMLVDGFASVKKCSTEGRAAMSLDLNVLLKGLSGLWSNIWPIPGASYVELYISSFYLPAEDLVAWIEEHPEYPLEHVIALANAGPASSMKKKTKAAYLQRISREYELAKASAKHTPE